MEKRTINISGKKMVVKKGQKIMSVAVTRKARATVVLGNGFFRDEFTRIVPANTIFRFTFNALSFKTISAGWSNDRAIPYTVLSFPQGNNWVVIVNNGLATSLSTTFAFIYKS
ncbi:hypothetical protein [Paenibacillus sp. Soil787]|uniref:hypothetical protein n=1 Tax=Paenibacillus sp. Soil787 TaxID=1736411 RepID=UPI0006F86F55|nr:hypothetical protein [Paenibacillus sp. Soil787]KRF31713.1 hypothetical protein ASG93_05080 [Paenibacillus sp. Soil787]